MQMDTKNSSKRPKPRSFVQYDPNNYYAILGISPLTNTREIKAIITRKQMDINRQLRQCAHVQEKSKKEKLIKDFDNLQKISEAFDSERKREEYDRLNPQNALLTVQPSDNHDWLDRSSRLNFVSAWLVEELGSEKFLPTPGSFHLWCPGGLDTELIDFLSQHETQTGNDISLDKYLEDVVIEQKTIMEKALPVEELENIAGKWSKQKENDEHVALKEQTETTNKKNKPTNGLKQGE
jgi:hypothetical protein